jgi:hypothetical protein
LGQPLLEGRALTIQTAIKEIEPYLIGKDPRQVVHHWQAIYRHAFYRGGPILTSALSGIDQALWDIKGKLLGVPVYELLGGPTRDRVRIYGRAITPEDIKKLKIGTSIKMIKDGLQHTQKVYSSVYEFTNLVKQNIFLEKVKFDIKSILEEYLLNTAYNSQVTIEYLGELKVNKTLFCNAIDNLIRNGLKYNDSSTKWVKIYIEDTYIHMSSLAHDAMSANYKFNATYSSQRAFIH